jgi:hypothetical protein
MEDIMRWEEYIKFASSKVVEKAIRFCENVECKDYPIYINDIEHRTQYEKEVMHIPCVDNLIYELASNKRTLD